MFIAMVGNEYHPGLRACIYISRVWGFEMVAAYTKRAVVMELHGPMARLMAAR